MKIHTLLSILLLVLPGVPHAVAAPAKLKMANSGAVEPEARAPEFTCLYSPEAKVKEKIDVSFLGKSGEVIVIRRLGAAYNLYFAKATSGLESTYQEFASSPGTGAPLILKTHPKSFVTVILNVGRTVIRWTNQGNEFEINCPH